MDLTKPLTAGAFVDADKIKELHDALSQQLPPEPPMRWLLAEKEKLENVSLSPFLMIIFRYFFLCTCQSFSYLLYLSIVVIYLVDKQQ